MMMSNDRPLKPTKRDRTGLVNFTQQALTELAKAKAQRAEYDELLRASIVAYGDVVGTPISGCYASHFPEHIKAMLRDMARSIGAQVENAYNAWRYAGRRRETLRPYAAKARELPDGRVSYY